MLLEIDTKTDMRIKEWCRATDGTPEEFANYALEEALDDWEDYQDALRICALVDSGRMKTYSLAEVDKHLDELDS